MEGGVHHVYARGNNRGAVYVDDVDREQYLAMLGATVLQYAWRCLGYCLMTNHMHLLIETPLPNLGPGMQRLHSLYAQKFNKRHARSGHLFQGRFGSLLVLREEQLWKTVAYIAQNPVAAGLCTRPADWPWSSHRAITLGEGPAAVDVDRLLSFFGGSSAAGRDRYTRWVELESRGQTP